MESNFAAGSLSPRRVWNLAELCRCYARLPKQDPQEPFGVYFRRLVHGMDVGNLTSRFEQVSAQWQATRE
jgi:hypothetical protein